MESIVVVVCDAKASMEQLMLMVGRESSVELPMESVGIGASVSASAVPPAFWWNDLDDAGALALFFCFPHQGLDVVELREGRAQDEAAGAAHLVVSA